MAMFNRREETPTFARDDIAARDELIGRLQLEAKGLKRQRDDWRRPLVGAARRIRALEAEKTALRREVLRLEEALD